MSSSLERRPLERLREQTLPAPAPSAGSSPLWVALYARLGPTELRRRLWHMAPGLLPFLLWPIPHKDPLSPILLNIILAVIVILAGTILVRFREIRRRGEQGSVAAVLGYAGSILSAFLLFPAHAEFGMVVLAVLAFGDGSATLCGKLWQGPPLPWNTTKSWPGLIAFCSCASIMATIVYWGEAQPGVSIGVAAACGVTATMVAALAESIPSRINDNIRVGLAALAGVVVMHAMILGLD